MITVRSTEFDFEKFPDNLQQAEESRLYRLVRQNGSIADRTFEIEFFDAGSAPTPSRSERRTRLALKSRSRASLTTNGA